MNRTRVKVCCMKSVAETKIAVALGVDALGLVGPMPSGPGAIEDETAAHMAFCVSPPIATFLLSSETTAEGLAAHAQRVGPTALQVVSHIDPAEYELLEPLLPRKRIKRVQVVHVEGVEAVDLIDVYAEHVDAFLLDSGQPSAGVPKLGGTGRRHDWDVSARFVKRSPIPVFLAGGLRPENVGEAIAKVKPFGVDLCTGVRTNDHLDPDKLHRFMFSVAEADRSLA